MGVPIGVAVHGNEVFVLETRGGFAPSGCAGGGVIRALQRAQRDQARPFERLAEADGCDGGAPEVVVDDQYVYWVTSVVSPNLHTIRRTPRDGGPSVPLVTASSPIVAVASDDAYIYWQENREPDGGPASVINRIPKAGGMPTPVAGGLSAFVAGMVVDGGEIFFAESSFTTARVMKVSVMGGSVSPLTPSLTQGPIALAVGTDDVFWVDADSLESVPRSGGAPSTVVPAMDSPVSLVVANDVLVWTESACCAHGQKGRLMSVPTGGGAVTLLKDELNAPGRLSVVGDELWWLEGGPIGQTEGFARIAAMPQGGGSVRTMGSGSSAPLPPFISDDTHLYFVDRFTIKRVPLQGGWPEVLAIADFSVRGLATDGAFVFWSEDPASTVKRVSVNGGTPLVLAFGSGPAGPLVVDQDSVFWIDHFDAIKKVSKAGGAMTTLATGLPFLNDLVVSDGVVYFSEQDTGAIKTMPASGGPSMPLASGARLTWRRLHAHGSYLYWVDQEFVGRVAKGGGATELGAYVLGRMDAVIPSDLYVDGRSVFWTEVRGGTIARGFAPVFGDVPPGFWAGSWIDILFTSGVTGGCQAAPPLYCPDSPVTREQMAVFLLKAKEGSGFTPPACIVATFDDVPCSNLFAPWIYELARRGITSGCAVTLYCPTAPVTREQMAVFLLGTSGDGPIACGPTFLDVGCASPYAGWIERLVQRGITAGCGPGLYCPESHVTRAQMAVFVVITFTLPL
jgi:hypothetical protein